VVQCGMGLQKLLPRMLPGAHIADHVEVGAQGGEGGPGARPAPGLPTATSVARLLPPKPTAAAPPVHPLGLRDHRRERQLHLRAAGGCGGFCI
jgi:hypothetical protein